MDRALSKERSDGCVESSCVVCVTSSSSDTCLLNFYLPPHRRVLRRSCIQRDQVVDDLDFVPMDEFQKKFFLLRQDEWSAYKEDFPRRWERCMRQLTFA